MYMLIIEYTFINLISKYFVLNFIITILSIFVLSSPDTENKADQSNNENFHRYVSFKNYVFFLRPTSVLNWWNQNTNKSPINSLD